MEMIYKILNTETKNWWHFQDLRKQNKVNEARQLERKSIKDKVQNLRDVLNHGGYLSLGGAQWSLQVFSHKTNWGSDQSYSLTGYYGFNKTCYLEPICKALGIPVLDSRGLSFEDKFEFIKGPIISKKTENGYISLTDFVESKRHLSNFKFYNIK